MGNRNKELAGIDPSGVSLSGLDTPNFGTDEFRSAAERRKAVQAEYKAKYGAGWFKVWAHDASGTGDLDWKLQECNNAMYFGCDIMSSATPALRAALRKMLDERCRELYGDRYDELLYHPQKDPRVAEILLADAVRTGKWMELPEDLKRLYHERAGDDA